MNTKIFSFSNLGKTFAIGAVAILIAGMFASVASAAMIGITVTSPNGGEAWNAAQTITWTCQDNDSGVSCAAIKVNDINYSPDGGSNWESIGYVSNSQFADSGSFVWDTTTIPNTESTNGIIEIIANSAAMNDQSDTPFIVDNTPPTILSATTNDSNGNGKIDELVVVFDENMKTSITSTTGFGYAGHTLGATGTWTNATTLTIPVTEVGGICDFSSQAGCDTDDTSNVDYSGGTLTDLATNALTNYTSTSATDGAKPIMVGAKTDDTNSNGMIDKITVIFSEDIDGGALGASDFDVTGYVVPSGGATEPNPGEVTITITESGVPDTDATPQVSIKSGGGIKDLAIPVKNELQNGNNGSTVTPADGAAPVAVVKQYRINAFSNPPTYPAKVDRFVLTFSESVSYTGSTSSILDDFVIVNNDLTNFSTGGQTYSMEIGPATSLDFLTTGTSNLTGVGLTGGTEPTLAYANDGTNKIVDSSGNALQSFAATSLEDDAAPAVIASLALDTIGDGNVDTLELQFSENVEDGDFNSGGSLADWALSSDSFSTSDTFGTFSSVVTDIASDADANDDFVSLSLTPFYVSGTGVVKYRYTNNNSPADDITDSNANPMYDFNATAAADGADPVALKIDYRTYSLTPATVDRFYVKFSENVNLGSGEDPVQFGNGLTITTNGLTGFTDPLTPTLLPTNEVLFLTNGATTDLTGVSGGTGILGEPEIAYATNNTDELEDSAGNTWKSMSITSMVDGAAPVALDTIGSVDSQYMDSSNTGSVTNIMLRFTESVDWRGTSVDYSGGNWTATPNDLTGFDVLGSSDDSAGTTLTFYATSANITGVGVGGSEPAVAYPGGDLGNGTVEDGTGNASAAFNVTLTDYADPVLVGFVATPNPAGIGNNLSFDLTFSEEMDTGVALTDTEFSLTTSSTLYYAPKTSYSGNLWEGDYDSNPIISGTPESGTHTFTSDWNAEDPVGNIMAVLSTLDLTFDIDSVNPETTGLEVFPSAFSLGMPVLITATVNDDIEVNGAELFVEIGGTPVSFGAMTESQSSNGGKTKTYELAIPLSSGFGFAAGETYNVYVVGSDLANTEPLDSNGDGTNDITTETITISGDTTAPSLTLDGDSTTVTVDADTYAVSGNVTPGEFSVVKVFRMVGSAPSGANDVYIGDALLGPSESNWEVTTNLPQNQTSKYYAEAFDLSLNPVQSGILTIVEQAGDTTPPLTPVISGSNETVDSDNYTLSGTAGPDTPLDGVRTITIYRNTITTILDSVDLPAGQTMWSVVIPLVQNSTNTLTVYATDSSGNTSAVSNTRVITEADSTDNTAPVGTVTTADTTVNADSYVISGTLSSDTDTVTVTINDGSSDVASTVVTPGGTAWSVTVTLPQSVTTTFAVKATDQSNNSATLTNSPVVITEDSTIGVDSTPPAGSVTTTATTVNADFYSITGTLTVDSDNVTVTINNGSTDVGTAVVTAGGTSWSITVPLIQDDPTTFTAKATDASANTSTLGSVTITENSTGPVNLTGLSVSSVADVSATLNWSTDTTADSGEYRIGTSPYSGTWTSLTIGGTSGTQALTSLTANTTYYYQVRFVKNSQTIYSAPIAFTTLQDDASFTQIVVTKIEPINTYATADDTWTNGWSWKFYISVPTIEHDKFSMKFSDFISGGNTIPATNNIRYYSDQLDDFDDAGDAVTITAANIYATEDSIDGDLDSSAPGKQIEVIVEMKVPTGSAGGSYGASYGVNSDPII